MRNNPRTKADDARRLGLTPNPEPATQPEPEVVLPDPEPAPAAAPEQSVPAPEQPAREPVDELTPPTSTRGARRPRS